MTNLIVCEGGPMHGKVADSRLAPKWPCAVIGGPRVLLVGEYNYDSERDRFVWDPESQETVVCE